MSNQNEVMDPKFQDQDQYPSDPSAASQVTDTNLLASPMIVEDEMEQSDVLITHKVTQSNLKSKSPFKTSHKKRSSVFSTSALVLMVMVALVGPVLGDPLSNSIKYSFSEKSSTLARLINGIHLGQTIADKKLNTKELVDELFSLGPNMKPDSLNSSKLVRLEKNIVTLKKGIETNCVGDNGCGVSSQVLDEIKNVVSLKNHVTAFDEALQASESDGEEEIQQLQKCLDAVASKKNALNTKKLIDTMVALETNDVHPITQSAVQPFEAPLNEAKRVLGLWRDLSSKLKTVGSNVLSKAKSDFEKMNNLKAISNAVQLAITSLSDNLQTLSLANLKLRTVKDMSSFMELLIRMDPSSAGNKAMTAGFFKGIDDFNSVSSLPEDPWLKEFLNSGNELDAKSLKIDLLIPLPDNLEPLSEIFKTVQSSSDIDLISVKNLFHKVGVIFQLDELIDNLQNCIASSNSEFDPAADGMIQWLSTDPLASVSKTIDEYLNTHEKSLDPISKLLSDSSTWANWKADYKTQSILGVGSLLNNVPKINIVKLKENTNNVNVIRAGSKNLIENFAFSSMMDCVSKVDYEKKDWRP